MPIRTISPNTFFRAFVNAAKFGLDRRNPPYGLILGAGASASAGIPTASRMVALLRGIADLARINLPSPPARESELSWLVRTVLPRAPPENENSDVLNRYQFLMSCICQANSEPNLTHLLTAHFTLAGLFGPIVTTNFDDLSLAAFWHLPYRSAYAEPHVVYDPVTPGRPGTVPGVPVIIKAHGHHTIWGTGVLDREIRSLTPSVKALLANACRPTCGYLVAGYSGYWRDGVVEFLAHEVPKQKLPIYWLFCGRERPSNANLDRIARQNDLCFVRIADSDAAFLRLWHEFHSEEEHLNLPIMEEYHLFNSIRHVPERNRSASAPSWWGVDTIPSNLAAARNHPRLEQLRRTVGPVLAAIDAWYEEATFYSSVPRTLFSQIPKEKRPLYYRSEPPTLRELETLVPTRFSWTARNRALLKLALSRQIDPVLPYIILAGAERW